tara:strand:- start:260 stop:652 length:393 start_codon:yes stop_codon:yes gene_type:complete
MQAFDIGFYSAWFFYLTTNHSEIFKRAGDKNLEDLDQMYYTGNNIELRALTVPSLLMSKKEFNLDDFLKSLPFIKEDHDTVEKQRVTSYPENYISCRDILSQNDDLKEKFIYKERYIYNLFSKFGDIKNE